MDYFSKFMIFISYQYILYAIPTAQSIKVDTFYLEYSVRDGRSGDTVLGIKRELFFLWNERRHRKDNSQ